MKWVEVTIRTTTLGADAMAEVLFDEGVNGVSIEDHADVLQYQRIEGEWDYIDENIYAEHEGEVYVKGYLPMEGSSAYAHTNRVMERTAKVIENVGDGLDVGGGEVLVRLVEDEDWAENWKQYYKPMDIGEAFAIVPHWEEYETERIKIIIDPGMAFGTGQHETTSMCLALCEQFCKEGARVFDIGCGTGILGIGAALMGAKSVLSVDRDTVAVSATENNAELNHCLDKMEIRQGDLADGVKGTFDLVFANIVADAIIPLIPRMKKLLDKNGVFIASGIIKDREEDILEAARKAKLKIKERLSEGEWVAFAMAKK